MKVVYNTCYGGFSLSREAVVRGREISGDAEWGGPCLKGDRYPDGDEVTTEYGFAREIKRSDPVLVQVVEELGKKASGKFASLAIRDVPRGRCYRIAEYDGSESVMTVEDYEWETAE